MERFVACFETLARRLEGGAFDASQITTCTAEEMALHLVIDAAEGATRNGTLAPDLSLCLRGPTVTRTSTPSGSSTSADHDVLLLFDAALDGIEAPNSALDEHGLFANLHPQAWFLPFEDDGLPRRGA